VSFGGGSYKVWMENFGDKMILWVAVPHKATDSEDVQKKATAAVEKWVSKNKYEDAAEMRVLWNDEWVWIGADYPYKGLNGKKVMNLAKDFENEYAPETAMIARWLEDLNIFDSRLMKCSSLVYKFHLPINLRLLSE
jgi:hypothetical protein